MSKNGGLDNNPTIQGNESSRFNDNEKPLTTETNQPKSGEKSKINNTEVDPLMDSQSSNFVLNDDNASSPAIKNANRKLPPIKSQKGHPEPELGSKGSEAKLSFFSEVNGVKVPLNPLPEEQGKDKRPSNAETNSPGSISPKKGGGENGSSEEFPHEEVQDSDELFAEKKKNKVVPVWKKRCQAILDNKIFNVVIAFMIFFTLFGSDVKSAAFDSSVDLGFDVTNIICMAGFSMEIILNILATDGYTWSFFFFLDIISTVSLILDIGIISSNIFGSKASNSASIARATRASRIGTKAGRIVRVVRLVRLAKLYKQMSKAQSKIDANKRQQQELDNKIHPEALQDGIDNQSKAVAKINSIKKKKAAALKNEIPNPFLDEMSLKESRVSKKLSDLTTKRLIVLVLLLLILVPLCDSGFFNDDPTSITYEIDLLGTLYDDPNVNDAYKTAHLNWMIGVETAANTPLVLLTINDTIAFENPSVDEDLLRFEETTPAEYESLTVGAIKATVSTRDNTITESGLNIGKTIFIAFVLVFGSILFSKDANDLVLRPIERMILKVTRIAKNPMSAKDEKIVKEEAGQNETVDIENAIIKIGGLLALGFGDAGSEIVAANMAASGDINPMLPGKKKMAIFGFCDIRNFTDATEVLQEDVMIFVNSIGGIVHSVIDEFAGSANKNIGDAFLLAWKIPDSELVNPKDISQGLKNSKIINGYADYALMAFLKIFAKINRNPVILAYRKHAKLNQRLENYRVRMGFGLHVGWAIEGAIGSHFKIDASYLSPNVNMASRFEAATKQYGVPLLFSGDLFDLFSQKTKEKCRLIDIITVKGSIKPVRIYTVDVDEEGFTPSKDRSDLTGEEKRLRQKSKKEFHNEILQEGETESLWETDKELIHLTRLHNPQFIKTFTSGFDEYVKGDWGAAKALFEQCLKISPEDGPTKTLMEVLHEANYKAPSDWNGYRVLTEK